MDLYSCSNYKGVTDADVITRLNNSFPLVRGITDGDQMTHIRALEELGVRGAVLMGQAHLCLFWHRRSENINSRYVAGRNQETLKGADIEHLVYVPLQNIRIKTYTAVYPGGTQLVEVNLNQPDGTLMCCVYARNDKDVSEYIDVANRILKSCVVINPIR